MEDAISVTQLKSNDGSIHLLIEGFSCDEDTFLTILARSRGGIRQELGIDFVGLADLSQKNCIKIELIPNMAYAQEMGIETETYLAIWTESGKAVTKYFQGLTERIRAQRNGGLKWCQIIMDQFPERHSEKFAALRRGLGKRMRLAFAENGLDLPADVALLEAKALDTCLV